MVTDAGFGYAADAQAKHQSQTSDSFFYVFGFRSTNASRLIPEWMGSSILLFVDTNYSLQMNE